MRMKMRRSKTEPPTAAPRTRPLLEEGLPLLGPASVLVVLGVPMLFLLPGRGSVTGPPSAPV
jgi:hypothetical protein